MKTMANYFFISVVFETNEYRDYIQVQGYMVKFHYTTTDNEGSLPVSLVEKISKEEQEPVMEFMKKHGYGNIQFL